MRTKINPDKINGNQEIPHIKGPKGLTHTPPAQVPRKIIKKNQEKPVRRTSPLVTNKNSTLRTEATIKAKNNSNVSIIFPFW
ncbi:MAG: hypothetical protein HQ551_12695 [Desulfobacteraceae bacterium]|nr:hypothetical protein [Desulfobacteraceae bacterium]